MKSFEYTVTDPIGIHARPAGMLMKFAKQFSSKITLSKDDRTVDVTRLMSLMAMSVRNGDTVTVTAEGDDEDTAIEEMRRFFAENL